MNISILQGWFLQSCNLYKFISMLSKVNFPSPIPLCFFMFKLFPLLHLLLPFVYLNVGIASVYYIFINTDRDDSSNWTYQRSHHFYLKNVIVVYFFQFLLKNDISYDTMELIHTISVTMFRNSYRLQVPSWHL